VWKAVEIESGDGEMAGKENGREGWER